MIYNHPLALRSQPPSSKARSLPFEWLAIVALLGFVLREPFAGAVQFYLNQFGLGALWFIPDAVAMVCVVALLAIDIARFASLRFFFILCAILYYMLLGYISVGSILAAFSGLKALLPLFVGVLLSRRALQRKMVQMVLIAALVTAVIGVLWSSANELPWASLNFDSGIGEARQFKATVWNTGGGIRPFGFSSDQHAAAASILFLIALIGAGNRRLLFYALSIVAGVGIYVTTSRTSLFAFLLLVAMRLIFDVIENGRRASLTEAATAIIPFFVLLVPVGVMGFAQNYSLSEIPPQLISLWIRGYEVFLQPFSLMPIFAPNAWLFGFGLGGVGFPLRLSDYSSYAAIIDNFLLFSYYSFGVPFLVFYLFICMRNCSERDLYKRILLCVTVIFGQFILGWATAMFMLVLGYAASTSFVSNRPRPSTAFVAARS